ncbi:hypothetical protein DPMN_070603 [Dreissena polymorpha]|uniref:Uncharacterized protein n=1 Tax=Dreissena polymorpha TaxID=45954 RepID=A0A9D3Z1M4_DREPO|nr:hypothetical protein DPMN_070603 [Dreissena polymorpha]
MTCSGCRALSGRPCDTVVHGLGVSSTVRDCLGELLATVDDVAKRSPCPFQTVLDTPRQSTTVPRGLTDNLRRCQTLPDSLRRCQEVFQTVSDGARLSQTVFDGAKRRSPRQS